MNKLKDYIGPKSNLVLRELGFWISPFEPSKPCQWLNHWGGWTLYMENTRVSMALLWETSSARIRRN